MKVLIISTCTEKLHEAEFVRPIEDIIKGECTTKHYSEVDLDVASGFEKVIICGTSLQDHKFIEDIKMFNWLKDFGGSVLGICAGMHVLGLVFGDKLRNKKEIGYYREKMSGSFLGLEENNDEGEYEVWHLHNSWVDFNECNWNVFMRSSDSSKIPEAVKHKQKEFYGVLFHPEVRQKGMIKEFIAL
ncbi:hypothetical protein HN747_01885 [archaeon]|nr:hypothetical protein [archaeon]